MFWNSRKRAVFASFLAILAVGARFATAKGTPAPDDHTGTKVGEKAPEFALKDQNGEPQALSELLKKGNVAIYFYRSAEWCPFCKKQLLQLQQDLKEIEASGVQVVAISYDSVGVLKRFAEQGKISYRLLSDPGSKTIDAYGIRNTTSKPGSRYDGIPYPGTYLVDQKGVVRAKFFVDGYRDRIENADVIKAAREIK